MLSCTVRYLQASLNKISREYCVEKKIPWRSRAWRARTPKNETGDIQELAMEYCNTGNEPVRYNGMEKAGKMMRDLAERRRYKARYRHRDK